MVDKSKPNNSKTDSAVKRAAEATANGVHSVTNFVARRDDRIADMTQTATQVFGSGLDKTGRAVSGAGGKAAKALHGNANQAADAVENFIRGDGEAGGLRKSAGAFGWFATKLVTHAAGYSANAVSLAASALAKSGQITEKSAPAIGGAVGGIVRGAAEVTSNAVDAAVLPASRIESMREQLRVLGRGQSEQSEHLLRSIKSAQKNRNKDQLLDLLVVGGVTLSQILKGSADVPEEVAKAFELAYPGLALRESFTDVVNRLSVDDLPGLVSGVKGKLFELELIDHLNSGGLPDGFHAELAHSATQAGWDIQVLDQHGQVSELLQAKATESVEYVQEALNRYPDIDITTTTEVHAQLLALGLAQNVHDSGISEAVLQAKVEAATHTAGVFDASDLVPSSIGMAVIALSVFMNKDTTLREKGSALGSRTAKAGASSAVGKLAMVATQTWWLGLISGVGASWLASRGHGKREEYEVLKKSLEVMDYRQELIAYRDVPLQ